MFFLALLQAAQSSTEQDAFQTLMDGVASGNVILAIVGGAVLIALVILGILKKDHPLIKPIAEVILSIGQKLAKKPKAEDQAGLPGVVPVKTLDQSEDKPPEAK